MPVPPPLLVPPQRLPIAGANGQAPAEWYEFFRRLLAYLQQTGVDPAVIADILARLDALEADQLGPFLILGPLSVQVQGTPQNGNVLVQLENDEDQPGRLYAYRVDDDGAKGWSLIRPDETPSSIGVYAQDENGDWMIDEDNRFAQTDPLLQVAADPDSTISNIQQTINFMLTPGVVSGCILSRLDVDTVRISAGRVLFASADDDGESDLVFFNVPAADFDIPADQETRYFAWTYNGGSPVAVMQTVDDFNRDTDIPIGLATRFNGTMVVTPNRYRTSQPVTNIIQRGDALAPILRDADVGGLTLGALATRISTVSGGRLWARLEDFTIPSQASNTAPMVSTYFDGTGLTFTSGLTQWDNDRYNDLGTGTLQVLGANKWAVLWFFLAVDGTYGFAYGTAQHNTQGGAANEALPPYLNQDFLRQAYLVGRYVFQKGEDIPTLIEQQLSALANISVINDHNSLANLQGGTAGEYYHLTAAEHTLLSGGGTDQQFLRGDGVWSNELLDGFTTNGTTTFNTGTVVQSAAAGGNRAWRFQTMGSDRWVLGASGVAESGGNAGSEFFINAYSDTGVLLSTPLTGFRNTAALRWRWNFEFSPTNTITLGTSALRPSALHTRDAHIGGAVLQSGVVSPTQLTANTDNWAVTGITTAAIIRASTDASRNLTGIASPTAWQVLILINVGAQDLVLVHDASSTAANRFLLPNSANLTLNPNDSVRLWYDSVSSRWRALGV